MSDQNPLSNRNGAEPIIRHTPPRGPVVNRTRRVVRERAVVMAARRSHIRSLWVPIAVFSALLVIICTAVWNGLDQYDVTQNGILDASNQFLVLLLWFFPLSIALIAVVLFRRGRKRIDNEAAR
jgi:hypothetical protein